jgi:inorganic pyrophosphatase
MNYKLIIGLLLMLLTVSTCQSESAEESAVLERKSNTTEVKHDLLRDWPAINEQGEINAVIEIPTGTREKWEVDKKTGELKLQEVNGSPRIVNYLPYPVNYGMIPQTLLPKELGGDGDPLDIIILGDPIERGKVVPCKLIGVLKLLDRGEQDDKLIAVETNSMYAGINNLNDLDSSFVGIKDIVETWFSNYKGPGKMQSQGYADEKVAREILRLAIDRFN